MRNKWKYLSLVTILLLSGCGGSSTNGTEIIKSASCNTETSTTTCPSAQNVESECGDPGGAIFYFGYDYDLNGILDESEIDASKDIIICNGHQGDAGDKGDKGDAGDKGDKGEQGFQSLIKSEEIPAGSVCTNGGVKFEIGIDSNRNNILDSNEVIQTQTICMPGGNTPPDNDITKIHEIQGSGATSPKVDEVVTVEAIVTGVYQENNELKGYFIQEEDADQDGNDATSEGIFVYDAAHNVSVGDKVKVTGKVTEFYGLTQIKNVSEATVVSSSEALPVFTNISLPMASANDYEKYEGMLIKFPGELVTTDVYSLSKYGEVLLSSSDRLWIGTQVAAPGDAANAVTAQNNLNQIVLDDASSKKYPASIKHPGSGLSKENVLRVGDTVTDLRGIMSYGYSKYRINPVGDVDFNTTVNPRATLETVNGNIKVASINVLNYFNTIDDGSGSCGTHAQGCRGADSQDELDRQTAKMLAALEKMDADIIGLMEVENDGGVTLQHIIDNLPAGYEYVRNPNGEGSELGTDVITVAMIYKTASIETIGASKTIADGEYQSAFDGKNRKPLAQTFKDKNSGEIFTIINNHFKSKGGGGSGLDADQGDGQGKNNAIRTKASQDILSWIEDLKISSGDDDMLIIGDLNAYAKEDPITTLENGDFANLDGSGNTYSYVYYGQSGTLDYALANSSLNSKVADVKRWHINADESWVFDYNKDATDSNYGRPKPTDYLTNLYEANEFRMSDHDPIIVGFNFTQGANEAPIADAGDDQNVSVGDSVTLDASGSSDNDGTIDSYEWKEGDMVLGTESTLTKDDFAVGIHTIILKVTDNDGATATDEIVIEVAGAAVTGSLFFSEYVEGGSNNKAVEIFNATGADVLLSDYKLERYSNGGTNGATINLDGVTLVDGDVYVVAYSSSNDELKSKADQLASGLNFNGDDALALMVKDTDAILDVIGKIGEDPGSAWGSGDTSTKNHTLRRKPGITEGDTDGFDSFDPSIQWDGFAIDTFDGLGER